MLKVRKHAKRESRSFPCLKSKPLLGNEIPLSRQLNGIIVVKHEIKTENYQKCSARIENICMRFLRK
jgi:hypothetical protein